MGTIRELIKHLEAENDLDAPVIYQYYLAHHFNCTLIMWAEVEKTFDSDGHYLDGQEIIDQIINAETKKQHMKEKSSNDNS